MHGAVETLRAHNPAALREGGKVLEWAHLEYLYYRYQGDAINAQRIKERCERVEDVLMAGLTDAALFGGGVGNALGNNLTLGVVPRDNISAPAFVYGQQVGDGLSMGLGVGETLLGGGIMGGGGVVMVTSGGTLLPVGAPLVVEGAAVASHGGAVMSKALLEFAKHKEGKGKQKWEKHSGRGDPHTNLKTKGTAQERWEDAKQDLAKFKAGAHGRQGHKAKLGGKAYKKKLKELETQVQHWKQQADKTGETHGRKGKGQR